MQEVKDRPTFSEMIQFFFDKAKGMSTQPPFLSVHIEAVRRVTNVLEAKFEETLTAIQKTASEQTEQVMRAAALVDNAHEGMIHAVRQLARKTKRQGRMLKGVVRSHMRRKQLVRLFGGWKKQTNRGKVASDALRKLVGDRDSQVLKRAVHTWKHRALLLLGKRNQAAVRSLEAAASTNSDRVAKLELKYALVRVDSLYDSKASTVALKEVKSIAEQRDYSSFLKDVFEYVTVQVKELSEVRLTQDLEGSKSYIDQQCRKVLGIMKERLDVCDRSRSDERVTQLERTSEALRLQNTLLGEKLCKLDFLLNVEDAEFKVSMLSQQLAKVEAGMERLRSSLSECARAATPAPTAPPKRPSTVEGPRALRHASRPLREVALRTQPHHSVSLVLSDDHRLSPTQPARLFSSIRSELPTPPLTAGATVESSPVSTRSKTQQRGRVEDCRRRTGKIRSGKPFADMKVQNRKVLDEMVIFSSKAHRLES